MLIKGLHLTGNAAELRHKQAKIAWLKSLKGIYTYSGSRIGKNRLFYVGPAFYELVFN